jgi:MinD superfamily P-loop ATPase
METVETGGKQSYNPPVSRKIVGGISMRVTDEKCTKCRACLEVCAVGAITPAEGGGIVIDKNRCLNCGCCAALCPGNAIEYE